MKRIYPNREWPESWKLSYDYDLLEIYGDKSSLGYVYAYQKRFNTTLGLIQSALPKGSSVIDIAAGQGNFSLTLAELGYKVVWNDLRGDLAEYVKLKHEKGDISYLAGNAFELNHAEQFDCVLISEVIEHVAHPDQFLLNAAAITKPGGIVVMSTPNGRYFRNSLPKFSKCPDPSIFEVEQFKPNSDGHIFLLWPDEIKWLSEVSRLDVELTVYHTNPLTAGHIKLERFLPLLPKRSVFFVEKLTEKLSLSIRTRITTGSVTLFRKPL
jgi:2-polyprenyl-6-hydroxyphenyl methylase/3-demethylubiquinone-9 3-methyltransferase